MQGSTRLYVGKHDGGGTATARIQGSGEDTAAIPDPAGAGTSASLFSLGGGGFAQVEIADLLICDAILDTDTITALYDDYYGPRYFA